MFVQHYTPPQTYELVEEMYAKDAKDSGGGDGGSSAHEPSGVAGLGSVSTDLVSGALSWQSPSTAIGLITHGGLNAATAGALIPPALLLALLFGGSSGSSPFRRRR